jgi:glycosyltransferase involved in cell wall biosynthesis
MDGGRPRLSVIIPTYNRAATLAACIRSLQNQDCAPQQYEIVVSDDGSSDATPRIVQSLAEDAQTAVRYLRQDNAGANRARNRAIAAARGSILLFINDDTIAVREMLSQHLQGHERHPDDRVAILGRVTISPDLPPSRLAPLHLDRAYAKLRDGAELDWRAFFTCNVSVKKTLLDRGGMFEERMRYHEDLELAHRLARHGLRVVYRAAALGYHDHFLAEQEFFAIAAREARALQVWSEITPSIGPVLATLGYEPALSLSQRARHRLMDLLINRSTIPLWCQVARHCPERFRWFYLKIYDQIYQSLKRASLRGENLAR